MPTPQSPVAHPPATATYRLQLHRGFDFESAAMVAPYLSALGLSHAYTSPQLQAVPGSLHGYDVVDHAQVSTDLGGEAGRKRFVEALRSAGLGQVLDVVPNHMAIGTEHNRWWWSLLREGPNSPVADAFDVDWDPPEAKLRSTVLLPVLADHYGRVLEQGGLRLDPLHADDAEVPVEIVVRHADSMFPVRVGSLAEVSGTDDWATAVELVNGSVDLLDQLLDAQFYRLAYWRTGAYELDYRRFFDVTDLAGLRVEDPTVFALTHELIGRWVEDGSVDGLRIDHPDGLRDPAAYLGRLRALAPAAWIVVEKILEPGEALPPWPVEGTTGYDALNLIGGLFIDPDGVEPSAALAAELTGEPASFEEVAQEAKLDVLRDLMSTEVHRLGSLLSTVCEHHRRYRDYTRPELEDALTAVLVAFGVYRTYVGEGGERSDQDEVRIGAALATARHAHAEMDGGLLELISKVLRADDGFDGSDERELRMRFQQLTGPTMAKGVEDTAIYRHLGVPAADEVGGNPSSPAVSPAAFHSATVTRNRDWPATMLALTTHDTKRSEDVRARLSLLSEIPDRWGATARGWRDLNRRHRGDHGPDGLTEYLIYLTLVGAHPLPIERARDYVLKAMREAKRSTSWLQPDEAVEADALSFLDAIFADPKFGASLRDFVTPLIEPGRVTSLAMKLLQLTSPGVPDLYQGTELWDLSLVDPDNRRPVDYPERAAALGVLPSTAALLPPLDRDEIGLTKLFVVKRALRLRSTLPQAYGLGAGYDPLTTRGAAADRVVAFVRGGQAVTVVPRLVLSGGSGWGDTAVELPEGRWIDAFGSLADQDGRVLDAGHRRSEREVLSGTVEVERLYRDLPVALLLRTDT